MCTKILASTIFMVYGAMTVLKGGIMMILMQWMMNSKFGHEFTLDNLLIKPPAGGIFFAFFPRSMNCVS